MQNDFIHALIIRSLTEELSAEEETLIKKWRLKSSVNEEHYQETQRVWDLSLTHAPSYVPDTDKHWKELSLKIASEPRVSRVRSLFSESFLYKTAAVFFVVTIGLVYLTFVLLSGKTIVKETASNVNVFYLPDSSIVWLNEDSKLSYPEVFEGVSRVVYLEGEAFFDVRRNPSQPFIIHAAGTKTQVLGTSFNIKAYEHDQTVALTVVTGVVAFSGHQHTLWLWPKQTGVYDKWNQEIALQKVSNKEKEVIWIQEEKAFVHNDVFEHEKKYPEKYIQNTFQFRTNLINQTVIEGQIENKAKVCSFSQIYFKVVYVSQKNKEYEHHFVVGKWLNPGEKLDYKQKLPDWFVDTKEVKVFTEKVKGLNYNQKM